MKNSTRRAILFVGDLLAISLFVPLGARSHAEGLTLAVIARNLGPVAVSWIVVALALRTYSRPGFRWVVLNWAIAVPLAVVARGILVGRLFTVSTPIFMGVASAVTLFLLVAWRLVAYAVARLAGWLPEQPEADGIGEDDDSAAATADAGLEARPDGARPGSA